jgi:GNAT superfamily N-acetyltransferase
MADATIDRIDPSDTETIEHLYNAIFRPARDAGWIDRRLGGNREPLIQVARIDHDAVGFYMGMETKPDTHYAWLVGVVQDMRRAGIASQLMHKAEDWAQTQGYRFLRFECDNRIRPFLHFGIANGFDIVGMRWDSDRMTNLIVFEKQINDAPALDH